MLYAVRCFPMKKAMRRLRWGNRSDSVFIWKRNWKRVRRWLSVSWDRIVFHLGYSIVSLGAAGYFSIKLAQNHWYFYLNYNSLLYDCLSVGNDTIPTIIEFKESSNQTNTHSNQTVHCCYCIYIRDIFVGLFFKL